MILSIQIVLLAIYACDCVAQTNKITFNKLTHDFGTFSEDSDPKVCVFEFTNHLQKPISIAHVQSTCGCAVPQYTKKAIQPGESGEIRITYNPQGRPGIFNRSILVNFSGQIEKISLSVKGNVTPGVTRKDRTYPYVIGDLQLRARELRLRAMKGEQQQQEIMIVNSGSKTIRMDIKSNIPSISAIMVPSALAPDQKGVIQIIRQADENKSKPLCIRIKENTHQRKSAGIVPIIIESVKCNQ